MPWAWAGNCSIRGLQSAPIIAKQIAPNRARTSSTRLVSRKRKHRKRNTGWRSGKRRLSAIPPRSADCTKRRANCLRFSSQSAEIPADETCPQQFPLSAFRFPLFLCCFPLWPMIIARSPLRISLGGGGTDLPSYYERFGGFLITAAIDKYVYITIHETFVPEFIIKYSKLERVAQAAKVEHPIIREALKLMGIDGGYLELTSMADIPSGTGLGSSGSFTTALLKALHAHKKNLV